MLPVRAPAGLELPGGEAPYDAALLRAHRVLRPAQGGGQACSGPPSHAEGNGVHPLRRFYGFLLTPPCASMGRVRQPSPLVQCVIGTASC
eukprot:1158306-Pelagomonas_calceolata.AAC.7